MFKDLFTGIDNQTLDIARVGGFIGIVCFCYNSLWVVYHTNVFSTQDFGIGFGALATGIGALLKLKENTEPPAK